MSFILGLFGPVSIIIVLVIMGLLSQRLGAVTTRPPLYRWFYVSAGLVGLSILMELLVILNADPELTPVYEVPMVVGLMIAVIISWRYWGWLLSENATGKN